MITRWKRNASRIQKKSYDPSLSGQNIGVGHGTGGHIKASVSNDWSVTDEDMSDSGPNNNLLVPFKEL